MCFPAPPSRLYSRFHQQNVFNGTAPAIASDIAISRQRAPTFQTLAATRARSPFNPSRKIGKHPGK
jgi:hypothetical protein